MRVITRTRDGERVAHGGLTVSVRRVNASVSDHAVYSTTKAIDERDGSYTVVVQSRYRFADADLSDLGPMAKNEGVIVYSTTWCGPCKSLQKWLTAEGIPFVTKDVENDPGAGAEVAAKLKKAGMQPGGVPVTDVAGTIIKGFDQRAIEQALSALR